MDLIEHITTSFEKAEREESKLTEELLAIPGMSGRKTRHLYNNLLNCPDARYLEVGSWRGSTACAAMFKNKAIVTCIDNWSEFGGPKDDFIANFARFSGENQTNFIESNCFSVNVSNLPKYNIYLYDGEHSYESHYNALIHFIDCMDDTFIFIVDDWNWKRVRDGTMNSIHALNLSVLYEKEIRTTNNDEHPEDGGKPWPWHNGVYVALLKKNTKPTYSNIWFDMTNIAFLDRFKNVDNVKFLEIGAFEGYGTNFFAKYLTGRDCSITCIDPWIKYSESTIANITGYDNIINEETYNIFLKNTQGNCDKIIIKRGFSVDILPTLEDKYDFVYVDGDHSEKAVWVDAVQSFNLLKVGGIMTFDDYMWNEGDKSPKAAVDQFLDTYKDRIRVLAKNYQVVIEKIKE